MHVYKAPTLQQQTWVAGQSINLAVYQPRVPQSYCTAKPSRNPLLNILLQGFPIFHLCYNNISETRVTSSFSLHFFSHCNCSVFFLWSSQVLPLVHLSNEQSLVMKNFTQFCGSDIRRAIMASADSGPSLFTLGIMFSGEINCTNSLNSVKLQCSLYGTSYLDRQGRIKNKNTLQNIQRYKETYSVLCSQFSYERYTTYYTANQLQS